MDISSEGKLIAKTALRVFGGKPSVAKYWDEPNVSNIDYSIDLEVDGKSLRLEFVGACATRYKHFPDILATCAFCVMNSKYSASPGKVFHNIVEMYYPNSEMKHILLAPPFLWVNLQTIDFSDRKVAWLLTAPISENEYLYAKSKGAESLEDLFERKDINIFDIERKSVL